MLKKAIQYGKTVAIPAEYDSIAGMFVFIAGKYPHKGLTFINASGDEEFISYPELLDNARRYLKTLYQRGVKPRDVVILEIDNSKEFYKAFWACILGGVIVAPVTPPASWEPNSAGLLKLTKVWEVLEKPLVVIEEPFRKQYQMLKDSGHFEGFEFVSTQELNNHEMEDIYYTKLDDLIFLQFSSGSTGVPKGVQLTNRNIITNIIGISNGFESTESDTVFTWLPHTHDMGMFAQHLTPMRNGCNIMVFSPFTFIRSPFMFLKKITEHKGTWFCATNFGYDWMAKKVSDEKLPALDLSSLRFVANGAEPISTMVIDKFTAKFSKCGFEANMMKPAYGMAEATVGVSFPKIGAPVRVERIYRSKMVNENIAEPVDNSNETDKIEFVHEGYPFDGVDVRIADDKGNTLDEYMIGEIQVKGENVTSGYYNNDEITSKLFVDEWLRTGDLGFMADNSLVVSGRIKDIIFVRGQNFFAHDLEEIIYELDTVERGNIALVGLFNSKSQQEELLVFIKYKSDVAKFLPIRNGIINKLHEAFGLEVAYVIPVSAIPKTTSGKVQRFQLRQNFENGEYSGWLKEIEEHLQKTQRDERFIQPPQSELEEFLRQSWSRILNVPEQNISVDDAFFALGGSSIKAYQLLDGISKYLKREVGSELLAVCKTIRQIAEYIEEMPANNENSAADLKTDNQMDMDKSVAITGLALRLPGAKNQQEFWENLCSKMDCISKISSRRKELSGNPGWDDWIGALENIECFDNDFFEISSEEARFMDPQQRLVLETSYEALEDAGLVPGLEAERNIGVYSGISSNSYYQLLVNYIEKNGTEGLHQNAMAGNMHNIISAIISHAYNFTGPVLSIDAACSSFMVALHHAVTGIRQKSISGAVVAGTNILATPIAHLLSRSAGIISSTRHARVFDKDADGTVLGEGVVVIYLEPLAKAVKENKNIYAVIRGTAINNDGYSLGIMAPNPKGQYKVLLDAYADANISPDEIGYIEAHGTGTTIGDPIEINALSKLFSAYNIPNARDIGIGSVKTNIGHLLPASGGAGLAKVLLCLKNKKMVPSLHMYQINPALQIEKTPFHVVQEVEDWKAKGGKTRKAGINSFGMGGTNAHLILEEWDQSPSPQQKQKAQLLTLSAKSEKALDAIIKQTVELAGNVPDLDVHDLCFTRNRYRKHYSYRAVCLISGNEKINDLEGIQKGQFLKGRSAKTCLWIGDVRNYQENQLNLFDETSETFNKDFSEIRDCAEKHGIINSAHCKGNGLANFTYWYSLINSLKKSGTNINEIYGTDSGKVLADIFNGKIDLQSALRIYFEGTGSISNREGAGNNVPRLKADIILGLCTSKENLLEALPKGIQNKSKIVNFQPGEDDSFDSSYLSVIGELYIAGADFNWEIIHPVGTGKLMQLPPYPFEKKVFWISELKGE